MNYFRRAHSKEVTIFHRRLLFLTKWLSVIYLTIFLFTNYQVLIFFSFSQILCISCILHPNINQILYICTLSQNLPSKFEGTNLTFLYTGFALLDYRQVPTPSLKIRTASAICLNSLGLFRDYSLDHIFF